MTSFNYDAFISYSTKNRSSVRKLAEYLKDKNIRVWYDEWCIKDGRDISKEIELGLQQSQIFIMCMTQEYFKSEWVESEKNTAYFRDPTNKELRFLPVLFSRCNIPDTLRRFKYIDRASDVEASDLRILSFVNENSYRLRNVSHEKDNHSDSSKPMFYYDFPRPRIYLGRKRVTEDLVKAVKNNRLTTVFSAIGGLGKTTIACQAAMELEAQRIFEEGIAFCDIESAPNVQGAMIVFGKKFNLELPYTAEGLIRSLRDKNLLIIIDNIEGIVFNDRDNFRQLISKVLAFSSVSILCTGREHVNLPEEKLFHLRSLNREDSKVLLTHHLYLKLDNPMELEQSKAFDEALDLCDGIPFMIEIVASYLPYHSLESYLSHFKEKRSEMLKISTLSGVDRLTNYVVSTQLTYDNLKNTSKILLRYLSILPAIPTHGMIPPLKDADLSEEIDLLKNKLLIDKSSNALKIPTPIKEVVRDMVTEYDQELVAKKILSVLPEEDADLEKFVIEQHVNLTWALIYVSQNGNMISLEDLVAIILNIEDSYVRTGLLSESKKVIDAVQKTYDAVDCKVPYELDSYKGNIERLLDNYGESEKCYERALEANALIGRERAELLLGQGDNQKQMQKYDAAEKSYREALKIATSIADSSEIEGIALWGIANIEFATSRWNQAKESYKKSLTAFDKCYSNTTVIKGKIDCYKGLSDIFIKKKELINASDSIKTAFAIFEDPYFEFKSRLTEAKLNQGRGDVERLLFIEDLRNRREGVFIEAERCYKKAASLYHEMEAPIGEALSIYKLGELYVYSEQELIKSHHCFQHSLNIYKTTNNALGIAKSQLALLKLELLDHGPKQRLLERCHQLLGVFRDACSSRYWQAEALTIIISIRRSDELESIESEMGRAIEIYESLRRDDKIDNLKRLVNGHLSLFEAFCE